ncbi:MAG TPA: GNAT family N-acetyltransferase [Dehalococcoidia bacterium]
MAYVARAEPFDRVAAEWQGLLDRAAARRVFYRPSWQRAWWETFQDGERPLVLTVRHGERLLALAPLMRRGDALWLAGDSEICDYMDVVADREAGAGAYAALLDAVLPGTDAALDEPWRELVLWGLEEESPTLHLLPELARARGLTVLVEPEARCPRVALPDAGGWEAYLAGLSKKDRHELRRKLRRLEEAGTLAFYGLSEPEAVAAAMDDFLRLHRISRPDKAAFMSPRMEAFFRRAVEALAQEGAVRLCFLELDGARVASVLLFDCGEELAMYNSGFDPAYGHLAVGLLSKALCVRTALEEGKRALDFLRGDERYKYDLGGRDRRVYRCVLRRP